MGRGRGEGDREKGRGGEGDREKGGGGEGERRRGEEVVGVVPVSIKVQVTPENPRATHYNNSNNKNTSHSSLTTTVPTPKCIPSLTRIHKGETTQKDEWINRRKSRL